MCFSMPDIPKVEPPPMVVEESPEKKQVEMATARRKAAGRFGIGDTWLSRGGALGSTNLRSPYGTRLKRNLGD